MTYSNSSNTLGGPSSSSREEESKRRRRRRRNSNNNNNNNKREKGKEKKTRERVKTDRDRHTHPRMRRCGLYLHKVLVVWSVVVGVLGRVRACPFDEPPPVVPEVRARSGGPAGDLCVWWRPPDGYDAASPLSYTVRMYIYRERETYTRRHVCDMCTQTRER